MNSTTSHLPTFPEDFVSPSAEYSRCTEEEIDEFIKSDAQQYLTEPIEDMTDVLLATTGDTIINFDPFEGEIEVFRLQGGAHMPQDLQEKLRARLKEAGY